MLLAGGAKPVLPSSTWGLESRVFATLVPGHRFPETWLGDSTRCGGLRAESTAVKLHDQAIRLFALVDLDNLDVEDEGGATGNVRGSATGAVGVVSGDGDAALGANGHAGDTDVPALDDLAAAELEGERLALLVAVEHLVVLLELADVAHADTVAVLGGRAGAGLLVVDGHALDDTGTSSGLGLLSGGGGLGGSRALLEVLGELNLLVGLVGRGSLLGLLRDNGGAIVLLHLLELLLAELLAVGSRLDLGLGDQGVEVLVVCGALVLALLGLDKLGSLLLIVDLGDAGVLHVVELVLGVVLLVELVLIGREVVLILVVLLVVLAVGVVRLDVVAGQEDAVGAGNLEVDALVLTNGDVERLLVVL